MFPTLPEVLVMLFNRRTAGTATEGDRRAPPLAAGALETGAAPAANSYHWRAALDNTWENPLNWWYQSAGEWVPGTDDWPGKDGPAGRDTAVFGTPVGVAGADADCTPNVE